MSQIIDQIKDALRRAKAKILEQADVLNKLTAQPRILAVVISVTQKDQSETSWKEFEVGTRVRVAKSQRAPRSIGQVGTIIKDEALESHGLMKVRLDDENYGEEYYAIGRPMTSEAGYGYTDAKELELLSKSGKALVVHNGQQIELLVPSDQKIASGDTVALSAQTMQIIEVAKQVGIGETTTVRQMVDEGVSEVDWQGGSRVVVHGKGVGPLQKGDRVVLDATGSVVVRSLGKEEERFTLEVQTNVSWDDIGGLEEAKQQMREAIELPYHQPGLYKFYGKRSIKGVLLYGPPGCGKTLLAKATATSLARIHGGHEVSKGFLYIKGPEILDRYVGTAEGLIRHIFNRARKHKEEHGYPAVIFIDEADAILGKRGMGISSDIERTIVPMFLAEMDGLEDSGAVVLLATNRADVLDPAVVRDGRIDRKIRITRPTRESAASIFGLHLKGVPLNNGYTHQEVAERGAEELFSESRTLYEVSLNGNGSGPIKRNFTLAHITNGGMIASIVDQATSIAMHRDIKSGKHGGLKCDDISLAIDAVFDQNLDLNHNDELTEFVGEYKDQVVSVHRRPRQTT